MDPLHHPHRAAPPAVYGAPAASAALAVILVHGRGQSPDWMREQVVERFGDARLSWHAPAADGASWYPQRFIAPAEHNEPRLGQALEALARLSQALQDQGIPTSRQVLMGFSQGACLASEFAWRSAQRYHALVAFTGGLIGEPGAPRVPPASAAALAGLPVLLSTWDADPHVPLASVQESAEWFRQAGAEVRLHVGAAEAHGIRDDEIAQARALLAAAAVPQGS
ncbi:MAG: dienelactone hydrolase family protein [Proteobacteria bacterium]|nr:dienelactone hydrolase family protein [Pseudomonadota bacterium]